MSADNIKTITDANPSGTDQDYKSVTGTSKVLPDGTEKRGLDVNLLSDEDQDQNIGEILRDIKSLLRCMATEQQLMREDLRVHLKLITGADL